MVWGSLLIAAAALKTPKRNDSNAQESKRRARDSRALPVEGGADGCKARALSV